MYYSSPIINIFNIIYSIFISTIYSRVKSVSRIMKILDTNWFLELEESKVQRPNPFVAIVDNVGPNVELI